MQRAQQAGQEGATSWFVTKARDAAVGDVSTLLRAWSDGDQNALEKLTPFVYDELRRLRRNTPLHEKRESPRPAALQTTA